MIDVLYHCFGSLRSHRVDTSLAVAMLDASGCGHLTLNTHELGSVERAEDLPVGYGSATYGSVTSAWRGPTLIPVLNINLPTSAQEAITRTREAVELTGITRIKLEVLTPDHTTTNVPELMRAVRELTTDSSLRVWPLVTPEPGSVSQLAATGCELIRVMGSPIGSGQGILPEWLPGIRSVLAGTSVPVMLDGGVGWVGDALKALDLGFSSVLVNSCLFTGRTDPVSALREFRAALGEARPALRNASR